MSCIPMRAGAVCYIRGVTYCCCCCFSSFRFCRLLVPFCTRSMHQRCYLFHRDQVHSIMTLTDHDGLQKRRHRVLQRRIFFSKVCMSLGPLVNLNQEKNYAIDEYYQQGLDHIMYQLFAMHCGRIRLKKNEKWRHSFVLSLIE